MNVIKHFKNIFYRENELSRPGGGPYGIAVLEVLNTARSRS